MAFTPQEMHDALARSSGSAATAIAHHVLRVGGEAMRDARYPELERQMGPDAARRLVLDTGIAAYSDRFLRDNPSLRPSETTQADAERKTFNALQSLFPHAPSERVGSKAAELFGRLGRGQQLQMAASDAGTAAAILSSVLHVDPNAVRAKAQQHAAGGPDVATGAGEHGERAHKLKGGAFARDAFGHHIHGGDQKGSSGSSERYSLLPGNNAITYGAERYSFAQMSQYAAAQGVPWAVHSPDLLKLGPSAIKAIADSGIKQPTYKALTNEAKFKAKDVVNLAHLAKDTGQNATDLSNRTVNTFKKVEPTEKGRGELAHMFGDYLEERKANQGRAATRLRTRVHQRYEHQPAKEREITPLVKSYTQAVKIDATATNTAKAKTAKADVKAVKADTKVATAAAVHTELKVASSAFDSLPDTAPKSAANAPASPAGKVAANVTLPASAKPGEKPAAPPTVQTAQLAKPPSKAAPTLKA